MLVEKKVVCAECHSSLMVDQTNHYGYFGNHNGYGMTKILFKNLEMI